MRAQVAIHSAIMLPCVSKQDFLGPMASVRLTKAPLPTHSLMVLQRQRQAIVAQASSELRSGTAPEKRNLVSGISDTFRPLNDPVANDKVLALSIGSMLCSVATLIHDSYLPIYLKDVLNLSSTSIGSLLAASQLLCQYMKGLSGVIGDVLRSQEKVIVFGFLLTLLSKPIFALSNQVYGFYGATACIYWIFVGKLFDRLSKGFREAPSKAVLSAVANKAGERPDSVFALRQSLATLGAFLGSSIAALTFKFSGQSYIATFSVATIPAAIGFFWVLKSYWPEVSGATNPEEEAKPTAKAAKAGESGEKKLSFVRRVGNVLGAFSPAYWQALAVVSVLYFTRFDFGFVSLRAKAVMDRSMLPLLTSTLMLTQAAVAIRISQVAKRSTTRQRNQLLMAGMLVMVAAHGCFCLSNVPAMFGGAVFVGIHMGMTHGLTLSMLGSYIPQQEIPGVGKVSGTAWSFTDIVLGLVLAASNILAGRMADWTAALGLGGVGCFYSGAASCVLAALLVLGFQQGGNLLDDGLQAKKA